MVHTLTTPAVAPGGSPVRPRSILAVASPAPEGWEAGGIQTSRTCSDPVVRDKCVTLPPPGDPTARPTLAEFPAFLIEQGSNCSTLSGDGRMREAEEALAASTDYALGLTLRTGAANDGAPNLDDARNLGEFADVATALAALECAAANDGNGQEWTVHASPGAAVYLAQAGLIDGGMTPSGAPLIVSAGYACDEAPTAFRIWATGRVWAGVGAISSREAIDRRTNNREGWAERAAIVGFNTCINVSAAFAPTAAGGGGVDPATEARITALETDTAALQTDVTGLETTVAGKADAAHTHDSADVVSGTLSTARIPSLSISKTTGLQAALDSKVESVAAGTGITVDATDPKNPIVSTTA